jgi:hypothetical protein
MEISFPIFYEAICCRTYLLRAGEMGKILVNKLVRSARGGNEDTDFQKIKRFLSGKSTKNFDFLTKCYFSRLKCLLYVYESK